MKREFLVERQGRWFALYAGLLDEAHSQGLISIRTTLVQAPTPENGQVAICTAEVTIEKDGKVRLFTGIGDASPDNVSRMMVPHLLRMAETRSKARALRDAVNVGVASLEELGETADSEGSPEPAQRSQSPRTAQPTQAQRPQPNSPAQAPANRPAPSDGLATPNQVRAIYSIARAQRGMSEEEVEAETVRLYGAPPAELAKKQASDYISHLKGS